MERDLVVSLSEVYGRSIEEVAKILKDIGFDGVMIGHESLEKDIASFEAAKKAGLKIDCIHLPILVLHDLWASEDPAEVEKIIKLYNDIVDYSAKNGVRNVIMHAFIGFVNDVEITEEKLKRFERIIERANRNKVFINFENAEGELYLDAIISKYKGKYPYLKYCLDTGHEMCYNNFRDTLKDYGDILNYLHIDDNLGVADPTLTWQNDYHYLPGDGLLDVQKFIRRIKECNYKGSITLELKPIQPMDNPMKEKYLQMGIIGYYTKAYQIALMIKEELEK